MTCTAHRVHRAGTKRAHKTLAATHRFNSLHMLDVQDMACMTGTNHRCETAQHTTHHAKCPT